MPPPVLKKSCKRCGKPFFTYENDLEFCNDDCRAKYDYSIKLNKPELLKVNSSNCAYCREPIDLRGKCTQKFCNSLCRKNFKNKESRDKRSKNPKPKGTGKKLSYEELNRRAEYNRVFDDHDWIYRQNRNKI